jgi:hypothetical protein
MTVGLLQTFDAGFRNVSSIYLLKRFFGLRARKEYSQSVAYDKRGLTK